MPQKDQHRSVVSRDAYDHLDASYPKGNNYLLAIAIDNYKHQPKLSNAVKDAEDIVQILLQRYGFQEDKVTRLYNENANKPQIFKTLDYLATTITKADNVLIYYAGHGYYHESNKTGHLIPQDAKSYVWEYLSNADLKDHLRAIDSLHTFLIIDSCFSGSLFSQTRIASKPPEESMAIFADRVALFPSRWCLAAGMIEEVSDGFHGENSPFAESIISYLERNQAAKFPVSDLIQYVKRVTPNNAKQTPIGGILLNVKDLGGEFIFTLKTKSNLNTLAVLSGEGTPNKPTRGTEAATEIIQKDKAVTKSLPAPSYTKWLLIGLIGLLVSFGAYYFFSEEEQPILVMPPPQKKPTNDDIKTAYDRTMLAAQTAYQVKNYQLAKEKYEEAWNYAHSLGYMAVSIEQAIKVCENAIKEGGTNFHDSMMAIVNQPTTATNKKPKLDLLPMTSFDVCGNLIYTMENSFEHELYKLVTKGKPAKNTYLKMDKIAFQKGRYQLDLSKTSRLQFDRLLSFMKCYPSLKIKICIYVKSIVVSQTTHQNELKYANALKNALTLQGIAKNRIETHSLGALKPLSTLNKTTKKLEKIETFLEFK